MPEGDLLRQLIDAGRVEELANLLKQRLELT